MIWMLMRSPTCRIYSSRLIILAAWTSLIILVGQETVYLAHWNPITFKCQRRKKRKILMIRQIAPAEMVCYVVKTLCSVRFILWLYLQTIIALIISPCSIKRKNKERYHHQTLHLSSKIILEITETMRIHKSFDWLQYACITIFALIIIINFKYERTA